MGRDTLRIRIDSIFLDGAEREVHFKPGLNVISGPISCGKTALIKLIRFFLGGSLGTPVPEVRATVNAVSGQVWFGNSRFSISRPAVSTVNAKVDIASDTTSLRLPASAAPDGKTYKNWLLTNLDLPRIEVPSAPTKPGSEPTPVSISDYLLYTYLSQKDLGYNVFGHLEYLKDIKRKYVYEIIYGYYDVNIAQIQDNLRDVLAQLRALRADKTLFSNIFNNTALENRAAIKHELDNTHKGLEKVTRDAVQLAKESEGSSETTRLKARVLKLMSAVEEKRNERSKESVSIKRLKALIGQLESQSTRLTRSIVSHKHLTDIDFILCPRCGSGIQPSSNDEDTCYLCHQKPSLEYSRETLIGEQETVESQLAESQNLLREKTETLELLAQELDLAESDLIQAETDLNYHSQSFISRNADQIASLAAHKATLSSRVSQLEEYLEILSKMDNLHEDVANLEAEKNRLEQLLAEPTRDLEAAMVRTAKLEEKFNEILENFNPPQFGEEANSQIHPQTHLPYYHGRRFESLSSPGLGTLVNVSHALAHQVTSIDLGLNLPNILILDGLSEHLGEEGLDPERLRSIYDYLIELNDSYGDQLQIILVDNEIPNRARKFLRLELSDQDRLIPTSALKV